MVNEWEMVSDWEKVKHDGEEHAKDRTTRESLDHQKQE